MARTLGQLAPAGDAELAADAGEVVAHPGEAVELKVALSEDDAAKMRVFRYRLGSGSAFSGTCRTRPQAYRPPRVQARNCRVQGSGCPARPHDTEGPL